MCEKSTQLTINPYTVLRSKSNDELYFFIADLLLPLIIVDITVSRYLVNYTIGLAFRCRLESIGL